MKAAPLIGLVLVGGAVAYAIWRLTSSKNAAAGTSISDSTPSPDNVQPLTFIAPAGDGSITGGASAPLPSATTQGGNDAAVTAQQQSLADANTAIAQNQEQPVSGFAPTAPQPIPTVPVTFLNTQKNPVTGGEQAVFERIDGGGVPAAAAFQLGGSVGFIEQVPYGAPSGSQNVVYLSPDQQFGDHPIINGGNTNGPLKPGDPGYDAALASVRAKIDAVRLQAQGAVTSTNSNTGSSSSASSIAATQSNIAKAISSGAVNISAGGQISSPSTKSSQSSSAPPSKPTSLLSFLNVRNPVRA